MKRREKKISEELNRENAVPAEAKSLAAAAPTSPLKAKKDFEIHHNDFHRVIRVGDDLSDVPELYHQNLRTEGVL